VEINTNYKEGDTYLHSENSQNLLSSNQLLYKLKDYSYYHQKFDRTLHLITDTKSYVPISSCVLEHILTTTNLTCYEKLYYILADGLAVINKNQGGSRSCALPSEDWAERLGCSRSLVFTMQSSLVKKGYFLIEKDRNALGLNKRNVITPTLPSLVFNSLNEKYPDRIGEHIPYNNAIECKLAYLDRTKLFIKINYDLLKLITSDTSLNTKQKIIWLNFYIIGYKNYMSQKRYYCASSKDTAYYNFSFISSYRELADIFSSNRKDISKSIRALEKLGFIKAQNIYIRKQNYNDKSNNKDRTNIITRDGNTISNYDDLAERQDKSLWQITVSLPNEYILELDKIKDRTNLSKTRGRDEFATNSSSPSESDFVLEGIRFNLSSLKTEALKAITRPDTQEQDITGKLDQDALLLNKSNNGNEILITSTDNDNTQNNFNHDSDHNHRESQKEVEEKNIGAKSDPHVAKSGLYINKYFKEKIKNIKSNLGASHKVIFNDFLKELFINSDSDLATHFKTDNSNNLSEKRTQESIKTKSKSKLKPKEFNIHSELVREKLKTLPKNKADKARKYAYCLISKKLATGYASSLTKHELAKELIFHAATWKPTKVGVKTREEEIDTALSVAWKAVVSGKWQAPLDLAKAQVLEYEFRHHKQKYQKSGVISSELKTLEIDTEKLLGKWCDLDGKIKASVTFDFDQDKRDGEELCKSDGSHDYLLLQDDGREPEYNISGSSNLTFTLNIKNREGLQEFDNEYYRDHRVQNQSLYHFKDFECNDTIPKQSRYDCFFETELPESELIGNNILYNVDLSKLSDSQKHVALRGSDTEIMEITTADNKQYFGKLKTMEVDENGELIMTFIPNSQKEFIKNKDIFSLSTGSIISDLHANKDQLTNYQYNSTESCINNVEFIQEKMQGFKSLDEAVSGIFDKLLYIKSDGS
jgi:flavodoxin